MRACISAISRSDSDRDVELMKRRAVGKQMSGIPAASLVCGRLHGALLEATDGVAPELRHGRRGTRLGVEMDQNLRANTLELACVGVDERLNEFEAFFAYAFGLSEDGNIFVEQSFGQEVTVDVSDKNLDVVRVGWFACNFFEVVALSEVEEVEIDPVVDVPQSVEVE